MDSHAVPVVQQTAHLAAYPTVSGKNRWHAELTYLARWAPGLRSTAQCPTSQEIEARDAAGDRATSVVTASYEGHALDEIWPGEDSGVSRPLAVYSDMPVSRHTQRAERTRGPARQAASCGTTTVPVAGGMPAARAGCGNTDVGGGLRRPESVACARAVPQGVVGTGLRSAHTLAPATKRVSRTERNMNAEE